MTRSAGPAPEVLNRSAGRNPRTGGRMRGSGGHGGHGEHGEHGEHGGHGGHGWMMIACCIPMLVIAVILVATGTASPAFLVGAVGCTLMMALMMRGMSHGGDDNRL